ncbi:MAG TPA: PEP/pyruvate-binding domain-containing protein [Bryobacteraceae bacterium]|nr:PEP/pyruvate-binding domain-containing protein [Bryobacteraceae bacterium]
MQWLRSKDHRQEAPDGAAERVRARYASFRELLAVNNESLELMAGLQDDLQYVPPRQDVLGDRIGTIFSRVGGVIDALERLTGLRQSALSAALASQRQEVERYAASLGEMSRPRISAWLSELHAGSEGEAGSKAAMLGEIRNKMGLPVPEGFVLTTEAYRQYCGLALWEEVRDATRELDPNDLEAIHRVSAMLTRRALELPLPRVVEVAITARAEALLSKGGSVAVRSSGRAEGGARSYAGQFLSLLNVPLEQALDAYKQVIAARFNERALAYRLSTGLLEVDNPMAALFLMMVPARAAGIMYTRDPADPKSKTLWITATKGLGQEIASGRVPADLYRVSRSRPHDVVERSLVRKQEELVLQDGGGVAYVPLGPGAQDESSLPDEGLRTLAEWGVRLEDHFHTPQDVEWVLDRDGKFWVVQSRQLVNAESSQSKSRARTKSEPLLAGGRTVYPGQTSGKAFLVDEIQNIGSAPSGAIVFIRKPSPEIVEVFPRIAGLVAEWGNIAGHAAALLREFQIPSVFQMTGAFEKLATGDPVSLDAVQARLYPGVLWPPVRKEASITERYRERAGDPISNRLLTLNLLDPNAHNFRPAGCKSAHDILRYCHEKAIEAMFEVNDRELERSAHSARSLDTPLPLNVSVLDLGGGLAPLDGAVRRVKPAEIVSRPFQALWKGVSHPGVTWLREMPASVGDLASVLANALTPQSGGMRALGEKSYLLVAAEYMNLNSRLAYHYSLVDACLSDTPGNNYISFRFEGGGASRNRRSLRACFLERCLTRHGFRADRRGDLVNAWFRKAPADQTAERLDILGRLIACSSQLDMYMNSREMMNWYADQFLSGNYKFTADSAGPRTDENIAGQRS